MARLERLEYGDYHLRYLHPSTMFFSGLHACVVVGGSDEGRNLLWFTAAARYAYQR